MVWTILLLSFWVSADLKPECTADVVVQKCEIFNNNKDKQFIKLENGTQYPNPFFELKKPEMNVSANDDKGYGSGDTMIGTTKSYEEALFDQAELLEILDGAKISMVNKLNIISVVASVGMGVPTHQIPWPLNRKEASSRENKTPDEILSAVKNLVGNEKFKLIEQKMEKFKTNMAMYQQTSQALSTQQEVQRQKDQYGAAGSLHEGKKREVDVQKLFDFAQTAMLQALQKGRSKSELSPEEIILVEKIKNIGFSGVNDYFSEDFKENCSSGNNGYFLRIRSEVGLCENAAQYPEAMLVFILAHEIGHSIDICGAITPVWRVDKEKLNQLKAEGDEQETFDEFKKSKSIFNSDPFLELSDISAIQKAIDQKAIVKTLDGVDPSKYPFKNEYDCLSKNLIFRTVSKEDIDDTKSILNRKFEDAAIKPEYKAFVEESKKRLYDAYEKYPHCMEIGSHKSEMAEVISDMLAVIVVEKFLKENPPQDAEAKFFSFPYIKQLCQERSKKSKKIEDLKISSLSPKIFNESMLNQMKISHPGESERLEKLFLNLPGMEETYGCKRKVTACFDHLSLTKGTGHITKEQEGKK